MKNRIDFTLAAALCLLPVAAQALPEDQFVNRPPAGVNKAHWHGAAGLAKYGCMIHFIAQQPAEPYLSNRRVTYIHESKAALPHSHSIDESKRSLMFRVGGIERTARYVGDQGCVVVPNDAAEMSLVPIAVEPGLAPADEVAWPMGDRDAVNDRAASRFEAAADALFEDSSIRTAAFIIIHEGKIVAERYGANSDAATSFHGWSMTKSIMATMMGVLEHQGKLRIYETTGFPEWAGDSRREIRLGDLLRMSSGLKCYRPQDYPMSDWDHMEYPHYLMSWTDAVDSVLYSTALPAQFPPGTYGRYKDCDPALLSRALKMRIEQADADGYLTWPQREIFDKIGVRSMRIGTDAAGNFITSADGFANARDWARLGLLWLNGGVAPNGERLLSDAFVDFVQMPAPAWTMYGVYAAGFWLGMFDSDAGYWMAGGEEQYVGIIPSHDLVIVRLAHDDITGDWRKIGSAMEQAVRLAMDVASAEE